MAAGHTAAILEWLATDEALAVEQSAGHFLEVGTRKPEGVAGCGNVQLPQRLPDVDQAPVAPDGTNKHGVLLFGSPPKEHEPICANAHAVSYQCRHACHAWQFHATVTDFAQKRRPPCGCRRATAGLPEFSRWCVRAATASCRWRGVRAAADRSRAAPALRSAPAAPQPSRWRWVSWRRRSPNRSRHGCRR